MEIWVLKDPPTLLQVKNFNDWQWSPSGTLIIGGNVHNLPSGGVVKGLERGFTSST